MNRRSNADCGLRVAEERNFHVRIPNSEFRVRRSALAAAGALVLLLGVAAAVWAQQAGGIINTRHNLTMSGPGPIRVPGETNPCVFCHTPHAANPIAPLWNRQDAGTYYEVYASTTIRAEIPQPSGTSRLCLSCHDGTIALTQTFNPRNAPSGTIYITPQDAGYIGTDLRDDHPISFVYDEALVARNPQLRSPASLPRQLPLDRQGRLQCTTCHDPHDDSLGMFLRMDNTQSRMCTSCHAIDGWEFSAHAVSNAALVGDIRATWGNVPQRTVKDLGCNSCHRPHSAGGRERLLRFAAEEDNCLVCHDGTVSGRNIKGDLARMSSHPVQRTIGVHDPTEDPATMSMHVECADCHNPHKSRPSQPTQAPAIKPPMQGASGVTAAGQFILEAVNEYEVCYKCHAWRNPARAVVDRVDRDNNIAEKFNPANPGYHPVVAQGKRADVPSLVQPRRPTDLIHCTDCHGSDGSGAKGPHGSSFRPLLTLNYTTGQFAGESPQAYALCYSCHDRATILADQSFSGHRRHVVEQNAPCSICHDPHGDRTNPHLINFDRDAVRPTDGGLGPSYQSTGNKRGTCTLKCHGKNHNNQEYPN